MADSLKARVREKLIRQITEDGGRPADEDDDDNDPRLITLETDLAALDAVGDEDPLIEELAARYWVP